MGVFDEWDKPSPPPPDDQTLTHVKALLDSIGKSQPTARIPDLVRPDPAVMQDALSRARNIGLVKTALGSVPSWNQARLGRSPVIQTPTPGLDVLQEQAMMPATSAAHYADAQNKHNLEQSKLNLGEDRLHSAESLGAVKALLAQYMGGKRLDQGAQRLEETSKYHATQAGLTRQRIAAQFPQMDDDTLDAAAEYTATTGKPFPGLGTRGGLGAQVAKRVAGSGHTGKEIAGNASNYSADTRSLGNLTKTADTMETAEGTASRNLDAFLGTAKSIADTGSPLLNKPVRLLEKELAGDPRMAAFLTAHQVATAEIAKVLSNPGSNAAMSDSARHEAQALFNKDASLAQLLASANVVRQDMENRKSSAAGQIGKVKSRISGQPEAPERKQGKDGKWYRKTNGAWEPE